MNINHMEPFNIKEVIELDKLCFERVDSRTERNVIALLEISKGGAFVCSIDERIIGYLFTHRYGTTGTIGPLGVLEEYRNKGFGKQLIQHAVDYLKQCGCDIIGLEVLPDKVRNISLYLKLGFRFVQPSLIISLNKRDSFVSENCIRGERVTPVQLTHFYNHFSTIFSGYSLEDDIEWVLNKNPNDIIFYTLEQEIKGFMCYSEDLYKYIFGYLSKDLIMSKAMFELYNALCIESKKENLNIRVNSKYNHIFELLNHDICIERTIIRMELKRDKEETKVEDNIVFRSWIG